jgi:hypothetical protein
MALTTAQILIDNGPVGAVSANPPIQPTVVAVQVMKISFVAPCSVSPLRRAGEDQPEAERPYQAPAREHGRLRHARGAAPRTSPGDAAGSLDAVKPRG